MYNIKLLAESDFTSVLNNGMSLSERLADGGRMILILMAFVFAVIFTIFLSQTIITKVIVSAQNKAEKKKEQPKAEAPAPAPVVEAEEVAAEDDGVTVAVITAALAAYLAETSEDGTVLPFRVVSFSRKKSGKPWNS